MTGLKLWKLLKTGFMYLLELLQGGRGGGRWWPLDLHLLFKGLFLGGANAEK